MQRLVGNVHFYYEMYGTGMPVVTIHGNPTDHHLMQSFLEPLFANRPGWQRIYFDLPGMGQTPGSKQIQSTDDILDSVVDFIDALLPGRHFLLIGESYGGYLSRGVLSRKFEHVEGMALICPAIIPDFPKRDLPPRQVLVEDPRLLAALDPVDAELFRSVAVVQDEHTWRHFREEVLPGLQVADKAFLQKLNQQYGYSFDVDRLPRPFSKPVVLIAGRQDFVVGYRDAWQILDNYPRATFAVLDRAGHNAQAEQDMLVGALLGEWLDRVQEAIPPEFLKEG